MTITCREGGYAEVMAQAKKAVNLSDLGIQGLRTRRAQTGTLVLGVPGEGGRDKAKELAARLREALTDRSLGSETWTTPPRVRRLRPRYAAPEDAPRRRSGLVLLGGPTMA